MPSFGNVVYSAGVVSAGRLLLPLPESTLIRSKLLVPAPAGLLHRPRVCQAVERGLQHRLTLVSAPAGYGKTSALVDFARHCPLPVCWYTTDERDCDLGVFFSYLVAAIGERFPGFGGACREMLSSPSFLGDDFSYSLSSITDGVGRLANEILELNAPFILVIDNYESVDGVFGIRTFMHRLLEVLPLNYHLMVDSRVLPDIPITRLVADHQLVGLTEEELRFTSDEIRELLSLSGIETTDEQVEAIAVRSEGWVTGVLLLANLLDERSRGILLADGGTAEETYAYLAREVLNRQPPDVQHFLRVSAVLREASVRLCREVLQIRNSRALLAELERRNLFVTRYGNGAGMVYRYHNLFRDLLHGQLRERDPAQYDELHRRAASWFQSEDNVEEAVYHYMAAEAYQEATALMEQIAREWFTRGRVEMLLRWAEQLPESVRAQAPGLLLYQSKVLIDRYDREGARRALAYAESGYQQHGNVSGLVRIHDQRAALALHERDYAGVIAEAQAALGMLSQDEVLEQAGARRHVGRAYVGLGCLADGVAELQAALKLFREAGSVYDVANLLQDLGVALADLGRFDEAAGHLNEALTLARRMGTPKLLAGTLNNLGWLHYLRGGYREAAVLYEEGLAASRRGEDVENQAYILVGMADLYRDVGMVGRAESLYDAAWQIAWKNDPGLAIYILTARADMCRWQADHARALELLARARRLAEEKGLDFEAGGLIAMVEGIARVEAGETEAGRGVLEQVVEFLEQRQARRELARAQFLLAKAHWLSGKGAAAIEWLERALGLASETGTGQFMVVEGRQVKGLLEAGASEGLLACREMIARMPALEGFRERLLGVAAEEESLPGRLEVYALGEERVVRDGQPVPTSAWRAAVAKELFFYVLVHKHAERGAIGLAFWPDLSARQMVNQLHVTVHRLRRALGKDVLVAEEGVYRLGEIDCWFDAEEFESLVERAQVLPIVDLHAEDLWRRAVLLYRGDFMPSAERTWCVSKREALREMFLEALMALGRCHAARHDCEGAIDWYRRALQVDPLREDIHQSIMRCYDEAGRRSEAVIQYQRCREVIKAELGVEPSPETQQLFAQISEGMI